MEAAHSLLTGNCVISVTVMRGPGRLTKDEAAWQDISTSAYEIQETCVDDEQRGGMQVIGAKAELQSSPVHI